ncbi:ABC transporter substrate-binding protein [Jeotgalibaca sp. A127]|uniref:ABC transporter substrate-binding protein n=1 Tax=Jeotgalibaca sp. A127 TaxID=3457324 RepID=UPI003FD67BCA
MGDKIKKALALGLVSVFTLGACNQTSETESSGEVGTTSTDEKVTIRIGTWEGGDGQKMQEEIAAAYMADNSNVEIIVESVPDNYGTKLLTQIAGGDAPDIFQIGDGDVSMFQSRGALENLTPYMEGDNGLNMDDFFGEVLEVGNIDGNYYTMPKDYSTFAIYYNKDLFDSAGVDYPTSDWTWEEFYDIAQQLTITEDGETTQWGTRLPGASNRDILPLIYAYGGDIIAPEGDTVLGYMDSDETTQALTFFDEMIRSGVAPTSTQTEALQGSDLFLSEKVAMSPTGIWPTQSYIDEGMNFGVVEVPGGDSGQFSTIYYAGYGIYSSSDIKDEAWDYLKYLSTEGQKTFAEHALSAYVPAAEEAGQTEDPYRGVFVKSVDLIKMFPERLNPAFNSTAGARFNEVLSEIVGTGNKGNLDIAELLDNAAENGQSEMETEMEQ